MSDTILPCVALFTDTLSSPIPDGRKTTDCLDDVRGDLATVTDAPDDLSNRSVP